jgi:hypothetical protein
MSAPSVLEKAADRGIVLFLANGRIRGRGPKPGAAFLSELRQHEAELVALLARRVHAASPALIAPKPATLEEPKATTDGAHARLSPVTIDALKQARRYNVSCKLDGDALLLSLPPGTPARIVDAIRANKPEIIEILRATIRPKGYSDDEWLAAAVDAARLGYPRERC